MQRVLPLVIVIVVAVSAGGGCKPRRQGGQTQFREMSVEALESLVARADTMPNVSARAYAGAYFSLAERYRAAGRNADAMAVLRRGLALEAWSCRHQILLAQLEAEQGDIAAARDRLQRVVGRCTDRGAASEARQLLRDLAHRPAAQPERPRPSLPGYRLWVVRFTGADETLARTVAARLSREFGIEVRVADDVLEPRVASRTHPRFGVQYDGDALLSHLEQGCAPFIGAKRSFGVVGILPEGLYARNYNFLFGYAWKGGGCGVVSCAMFAAPRISRATFEKRVMMQALSTAGFVIGIERCTSAWCARAYPHSLEEHDRKEDRLCNECVDNLTALYGRIAAANAPPADR